MYMYTNVCILQIPAKYKYVLCMFYAKFSQIYFSVEHTFSYIMCIVRVKIRRKQD